MHRHQPQREEKQQGPALRGSILQEYMSQGPTGNDMMSYYMGSDHPPLYSANDDYLKVKSISYSLCFYEAKLVMQKDGNLVLYRDKGCDNTYYAV